eukprot:1153084-Pelagomonas_calceolata.AAC.9
MAVHSENKHSHEHVVSVRACAHHTQQADRALYIYKIFKASKVERPTSRINNASQFVESPILEGLLNIHGYINGVGLRLTLDTGTQNSMMPPRIDVHMC